MTEEQAYRRLGWPLEGGGANDLVLPVSGSQYCGWCAYSCLCGYGGMSVEPVEKCVSCGLPWTVLEKL